LTRAGILKASPARRWNFRGRSAATSEQRFDALSRIDLAPGEYELRVAVSGEGRTASVFSYVTVPAFAAAPLSLSNIVVAAPSGTLTAPKDFLSPLVPIVPTARREFARTDRFAAFFRIYEGTDRQDPLVPVQLQSTIVDAGDRVVARRCARSMPHSSAMAVPLTTTSSCRSPRCRRATTCSK
jgi:hypothetical protein